MQSNSASIALLALAAALVAGCGHESPPPKSANAPDGVSVTQSPPVARKSDQTVNLSQDIRTQCNIDDSDRAPKFDFDSYQLAGNDRDILTKVAECFTTGPLKARGMHLVGRADPRGEAEYNMNLGESRATSVRRYLAALGVDSAKMSETSRGALDASGHDEETWRKDRRVDIDLVK
jgi:peptidoglycan-associated lipoprotein